MPKLARLSKKRGNVAAKMLPLNLRTTATIRSRLEEAAAESGRSLTREVENRLERSFAPEPNFEDRLVAAYGPQGAALLQIFGREMRGQINNGSRRLRAHGETGLDIESDWMGDPTTYALVERACAEIFKILRPAGDAATSGFDPENSARRLLAIIAAEDRHSLFDPGQGWGTRLRKLLGDRASQRLAAWWQSHTRSLDSTREGEGS